tara:strand:+ start:13805 stop:16915 length:3111 start_codon:yes stop_codon:yes gene_type:complete
MAEYSKTTYGYKEMVFFGIIDTLVNLIKMPTSSLESFSQFDINDYQHYDIHKGKYNGIPYVTKDFIEAIASIQKVKAKRTKNINSYKKILDKGGYSKVLQEQLATILGDPSNQYNAFTRLDSKKPDMDSTAFGMRITLNNSKSSLPDLILRWTLDTDAYSRISIHTSTASNLRRQEIDAANSFEDIQVLLNNDSYFGFSTLTPFIEWMFNNFRDELPNGDDRASAVVENIYNLLSGKVDGSISSVNGFKYSIMYNWKPQDDVSIIELTQTLRLYFNTNFQNKILEYSLGLKVSIIKEAVNALKNIKPVRGGSNLLNLISSPLSSTLLTNQNKQSQVRDILDNRNWDDINAQYKSMFLNNAYIKRKYEDPSYDSAPSQFSAMIANFVGFAVGLNTRIPINALMSLRYLEADLANFKYKVFRSEDYGADEKKFIGVAEGYISTKDTSKYFSALKGNITPFGYFVEQGSYNKRPRYSEQIDFSSAVYLANRIAPPLNNGQRDSALGKFKDRLRLFDESEQLSLGNRYNYNFDNSFDRRYSRLFSVNSFNTFHFLSRGYRAAVARTLAKDNVIQNMVIDRLPTSSPPFLPKPYEVKRDYLGYFDVNNKPIEARKSFDDSENYKDYWGGNSVKFKDHPLRVDTSYYFQDAFAREKDFPRGLNYLSYMYFTHSMFKYPFKKDGSATFDKDNPYSEAELTDKLETHIKVKLVEEYMNNPYEADVFNPFQTAVTSFVKGDVVIVSSFYNNEMFGYLTPNFVFENDYVKTPFFKQLAYGVTTLGSQNERDVQRQYQRSTPIDVCYAVIQEDMPSDFDIVSDTIKCSVVYQLNGKTIVEDWALPLANLQSQSGVQTLNITSSMDDDANLGDNLINEELEKNGLSLADYLANAADQTTINALIRPAYTNIYAKEFTYYELSGYLMDYTNVAKEIGVMQRATLDYKPRLLNLKDFKEEYNSLAKSDDVMKDLTDKYFKGKEDTIVYKYLKRNIKEFISLYGRSEKGINDVFKALNSLAKYEAECYVDDGSPKPKTSKKEDLKSLIDNI